MQSIQAAELVELEYFPCGQYVHSVRPDALAYCPLPHERHAGPKKPMEHRACFWSGIESGLVGGGCQSRAVLDLINSNIKELTQWRLPSNVELKPLGQISQECMPSTELKLLIPQFKHSLD
jgi:hypothetical protein